MTFEHFENPSDIEKNAHEVKVKYKSIYLKLQGALILDKGYRIDSPDPTESSHEIHRWAEDESANDYMIAFYYATQEHPDLIEIFKNDQTEALRIVRESFERVHQHA
ncbi:MAG: hypothetical protein K0S38_714 [Candidatus Paceibacter sp.]|jgi:hypothetical protein|nr:hypothetical protein [Candidatus Paceibacter sp.]